MNNRKYSLDFLKCISCIGVVFIHVLFPGKAGLIIKSLSAFAVPIFFMISGYYILGQDQKVIKIRRNWTINMLVVMYITYLAYNIVVNIKRDNLLPWLAERFTWKALLQYVFCCTVNFGVAMWFLIAMIEIYIIWEFVAKKGYEKKLLRWVPVFFALMIIQRIYTDTINAEFYMKTNVITSALPWFMTGYYLHTEDGKKLLGIEKWKLVVSILVGAAISAAPFIFETVIDFSVVGWIPMAIPMMVLALQNPQTHISRGMEYVGKNLSGYIYIFHQDMSCIVCFIMGHVFNMHEGNTLYDWSYPVLTLIATIAFAVIINYIQEKVIKKRLF